MDVGNRHFFVLNTNLRFLRVGLTFQKAKRRMEDQLNKIGFGKSKKKESLEDAPGSCKSARQITRMIMSSLFSCRQKDSNWYNRFQQKEFHGIRRGFQGVRVRGVEREKAGAPQCRLRWNAKILVPTGDMPTGFGS